MTEAKNLAKTYVYTNHRERSHSILSHSSRMPPPHPPPPGMLLGPGSSSHGLSLEHSTFHY